MQNESVEHASSDDSDNQSQQQERIQERIHDRITTFATQNPTATEYCIKDEFEAQELIVVLMAVVDNMMRSNCDPQQFDDLRNAKRTYKRALLQSKSLDLLREMTTANDLEYCGLSIVLPEVH